MLDDRKVNLKKKDGKGSQKKNNSSLKSFFVSNKEKEFVGNWYVDRYLSAVTQRNIIAVLFFAAMIVVIFSVIAIMQMHSARTLEPFVIEIDKKSGVSTMVDLNSTKVFSGDRAVNEYFIFHYIKARELYDPLNYRYYWFNVVRLLSTPSVYNEFTATLTYDKNGIPLSPYSSMNYVKSIPELKIRSIQYLGSQSVQVRFTIEVPGDKLAESLNKIALINFVYKDMTLTQAQRYINPLGFQITSYRLTDEFLQ